MSAAFDVVDHTILLQKLQLYGFEDDSSEWIASYLTDRKQCVCISGTLSKLLPVPTGVPQGSILGPLLYTIFVNELPEIIHNHDSPTSQSDSFPSFNTGCGNCGSVVCYADDSTLSITASDPLTMSQVATEKINLISDFLVSNRLKLNENKTHALFFSNKRKQYRDQVKIASGNCEIKLSTSEKLLGAEISEDLKWSIHIQNMLKSLATRLSAIKKISMSAPFKTRKMIANGIFMGKLSHLIALWSGGEGYLLKSLQVLQSSQGCNQERMAYTYLCPSG